MAFKVGLQVATEAPNTPHENAPARLETQESDKVDASRLPGGSLALSFPLTWLRSGVCSRSFDLHDS